jgi:CRP-like cAMP-binding protein
MLTQLQLYDAIDETPGIAINIIRLLSRRIRELNNKVNAYEAKSSAPDLTRTGSNLSG